MQRIAIASSRIVPGEHPDDASLRAALAGHGATAVIRTWNDPAVDWTQFDAVVLRSTWDYFQHYGEFLGWLEQLDRAGVATVNHSRTLRWNSDKRYLLDFVDAGIPVVPTCLADAASVLAAARQWDGREVVIKPTVSGTAWLAIRGWAGSAALAEQAAGLPVDLEYLVQPFLPEIERAGEWSLVYLGGQFSHAVIKRPAAGDYRVQGEFGGTAECVEPEPSVQASAARVLQAAAQLGHGDHAYARVDGVVVEGQFLLMELELIEPYLHLARQDGAAERLAAAVLARLPRVAGRDPASAGQLG
jgi:glutathione synthase/RimK-type ligase-like ATP-grasp enzyme